MFKERGLTPLLCRNRIAGKLAILLENPCRKMTREIELDQTENNQNTYFAALPESPEITFNKFTKTVGWKKASKDELIAGFVCISNETNSDWDSGYYELKENRLYDPDTKRFIYTSINSGTTLDKPEGEVIKQLEAWANGNESGIAVWISPKSELYPGAKLSIYRIAYKLNGEKTLLRSHYLFDAELKNSEDLRGLIFPEADKEKSIFEIIKWVEEKSNKNVSVNQRSQSEIYLQAARFVDLYHSGMSGAELAHQMSQSGFMGERPINCRNSSSTGSNSYDYSTTTESYGYRYANETKSWAYHIGTCARCHDSGIEVGPCEICKVCEKII